MSEKRKKVLWLSDHPLVPSGVGNQARLAIIELLRTKKYKFTCFGGAIKHPDYKPQQVAPEEFGEGNWIIYPVDGHGDKNKLREFLAAEKPDVVVLFTDPRFFYWVWEMEDEVRAVCPIVYWHVWDNDPIPEFNRAIYEANDYIMPLSLKTYGILQGLNFPKERFSYVPHAVPDQLFKPLPQEEVATAKKQYFGPFANREFIVMWNNRNARRKMTGDVLESFAKFAKKVGKDKTAILMHTAANDPEGQDLHAVAKKLGIQDCLLLSEQRISPEQINIMYNCSDCVINLSNNEGFGLGTLEAMFAGTPIIVNMTGGLQFQMGDWWCDLDDFSNQEKLTKIAKARMASHRWWGIPVFPAVRNLVGSQSVPYIYDDRANNDDVAKALEKMFKMGKNGRRKIGLQAREWVKEKFNLTDLAVNWDNALTTAITNYNNNRGIMNGLRVSNI